MQKLLQSDNQGVAEMTDAHLQIDWIDWMCGEMFLLTGYP